MVDLVVNLVQLQGEDTEDDGVFSNSAEYHEDASHHELVDGIEPAGGGGGCRGTDVVKDVDDHKEEDDEQRHPAWDDLKVLIIYFI